MASETVKVENGTIVVERFGPGKESLEVSLSDVEAVSFERGGEGDGQSIGALILSTKDGENHVIRVQDNEAGKYLKLISDGSKKPVESKPAAK